MLKIICENCHHVIAGKPIRDGRKNFCSDDCREHKQRRTLRLQKEALVFQGVVHA